MAKPDSLKLQESLASRKLMLAIDRLDYSKGIPARFEACEELLHNHPEHRGAFDLVQIASPSRSEVASYRDLRREIDRLSGRINSAFSDMHWAPIRYLARTYPRPALAGFCRVARVGLVTPLRDGMNLVAKEYSPPRIRAIPACWSCRVSPAPPRNLPARSSSILMTSTNAPRRCIAL